jgi:methionyl-tRNA formyltransferase
MRIIYMGTPEFAVPSLDILIRNKFDVVAVITAPDSYGGRGGKQLIESYVKRYAAEKGIPILQPTNLKSPAFINKLKSYNADLQVVVAFRMLPEVVWNMPPLGTINLHGSLLPKYRGAAPIHHAVMNGDQITGVTCFKLQHAIDTGDIIVKTEMSIGPDESIGSVHDRMMIIGAETILKSVNLLDNGNINFIKQNDQEASHAPKLFHENTEIKFSQKTSIEAHNFVRGLSPFPGAWCKIDGLEYKIYKARISELSLTPGAILCKAKSLTIGCKVGSIEILEIKAEGKKTMTIDQYLNGHMINKETVD